MRAGNKSRCIIEIIKMKSAAVNVASVYQQIRQALCIITLSASMRKLWTTYVNIATTIQPIRKVS
jgi:hypothetical protein